MAVESSISQDFVTKKNREGSEPKKKLKKTRSIRLSKAPSLKSSSRRSKSRFSWLSVDLSSDTSTATGLSDSSSNNINAASNSDAKKENYQGGNETDDAVSVGSSSYGSFVNGQPALNQANRIKKMLKNYGSSMSFRRQAKSKTVQSSTGSINSATLQHHQSFADGSPSYLKETSSSGGRKARSQATPRYSEPSLTDSDQSNGHSSSSSTKSVKIVMNETSFSGKMPSVKSSQISEDSNVDKATCSSILKDSKFPERVELHDGGTEAERISKTKVCPYHHCSLNGHSHDPTTPPKSSLNKKGRSLKSQESKMSIGEPPSGVKLPAGRKKELHIRQMNSNGESSSEEGGVSIRIVTPADDDKDMRFSIEIYAKSKAQISIRTGGETKDAEVFEIFPGEASYVDGSQAESAKQVMSSSRQMQDVTETSDLKRTSVHCCCAETGERKLTSVTAEVGPDEVPGSNIGDEDQDSIKSGNSELPHEYGQAPIINLNDRLRTSSHNDSNLNCKLEVVEPSTLPEESDRTDEARVGGKNNASDSQMKSVTGLEQADDSEKQFMEAKDSESSAPSQEGLGAQINKQKRINMWNLIHQHMASGLAAESEISPLHRENEEKLVADTNQLPAATITDPTENSSDSDISAESHDSLHQDIEVRKLFAIKLVREAIEKILLPEVPDQASDNQSIITDTVSDQDPSESYRDEEHAEDVQREYDQGKGENNAAVDRKKLGHDKCIFDPESEKTERKQEKKSDKRAPLNWSNLKKWIVLQRFIKALENVKQFNPKQPRHLQLQPEPDSEKVSLRHQTVEERKKAEEWMLDYALRQAVSELAPTQKKKVSLLVKAFETVKPPQEDSGVQWTFAKLKETRSESRTTKITDDSFLQGENKTKAAKEAFTPRPDYQERYSTTDNEATNPSVSMVAYSRMEDDAFLKPDDIANSSPGKVPGDKTQNHDNWEETVSNLKTNAPKEESISRAEEREDLSIDFAISTEIISSASGEISSKNPLTSGEEMEKESDPEPQQIAKKEKLGESRPEAVVLQGYCMDSKSTDNDSEEDKKYYITMWHMVYQHVVSSIAEKVGPKLLEGTDDEEAEDGNKLPEFSNENEDAYDDNSETHWTRGFSKTDAVKLVQEAVDEILLPEIQDDSSERRSVSSDIVQDQRISEINHTEGVEQNISNSPELIKDDLREKESKEDKKSEPIVHNKSELPKPKNWSKIKKLILLKRSLRALETARKFQSHQQKDLQLTADPEPEKVDLRNQMLDERKKAEQWMLDYAVQHIVNKLTPARKRRVAMLVEAFEAVVPLPEM